MRTNGLFYWLHSRMDRWRLCLLVFVILYGFALTVNLSYMSMEWDEVTHFNGALRLSRGQVGDWVWNNSFYPPAFDIAAAFFYITFGGASVFAARFVSVTFSVLSLLVIYEIAYRMYDAKTALLATILFGVMPGIVWLSRMAMIETMLIFFFSLSMLFFFSWLKTGKERDRIVSIAALAVGVGVKYQMLVVVPIIILLGMFFWKREFLKAQMKLYLRFPRVALIVAAVTSLAVVAYALYASGLMSTLLYAIQFGTADKALYSARYPMPIFYFIEMAWSNNYWHPVSVLLYVAALAGLGLLVYRRKFEDKFLLLLFAVIFAVFTLIPNREWRYLTIAFPILAIATSSLVFSVYGKVQRLAQATKGAHPRKWATKLAALTLIGFTSVGIFYSCADAYTWVNGDQISVPIEQATNFAAQGLGENQKLMVACPLNRFNQFMLWFYLNAKTPSAIQNQTMQYPQLAVDAYTPTFDAEEFVALCDQQNVKEVLLYEYGGNRFFNSTMTTQTVLEMLSETGRFGFPSTFGSEPHRVFVLTFRQRS